MLNKRCRIIQKIDYTSLKNCINVYNNYYGKSPSYIIVNKKTLQAMKEDGDLRFDENCSKKTYGVLFGIPIAICDALNDYDVEVV